MKLTLVLRDKKNALKLSTKTIESFIKKRQFSTIKNISTTTSKFLCL